MGMDVNLFYLLEITKYNDLSSQCANCNSEMSVWISEEGRSERALYKGTSVLAYPGVPNSVPDPDGTEGTIAILECHDVKPTIIDQRWGVEGSWLATTKNDDEELIVKPDGLHIFPDGEISCMVKSPWFSISDEKYGWEDNEMEEGNNSGELDYAPATMMILIKGTRFEG